MSAPYSTIAAPAELKTAIEAPDILKETADRGDRHRARVCEACAAGHHELVGQTRECACHGHAEACHA